MIEYEKAREAVQAYVDGQPDEATAACGIATAAILMMIQTMPRTDCEGAIATMMLGAQNALGVDNPELMCIRAALDSIALRHGSEAAQSCIDQMTVKTARSVH